MAEDLDRIAVAPAAAEAMGEGAQALLSTIKVGFFVLKMLIVVLIVLYFSTGVFYVEPNQQAYVLRFGRIVGDTPKERIIESGRIAWAWPRPVDQVKKVAVLESRTLVTSQFWYFEQPKSILTANQKTEPGEGSEGQGELKPGTDGYLLTADTNLLHTRWSLVYKIEDPIAYIERSKNAEAILKCVLDHAVLLEVSGITIDTALYHSEALRDGVRRRVLQELLALKERQCDVGVDLASLEVYYVDKTPPRATLAAFSEVTKAEQRKDTEMSNAEAYKRKLVEEARGEASRIRAEAQAYRQSIIAQVKADADYFSKIKTEYDKSGISVLAYLYADTLTSVLDNIKAIYLINQSAGKGGQEIRLFLGPEAAQRSLVNEEQAARMAGMPQ